MRNLSRPASQYSAPCWQTHAFWSQFSPQQEAESHAAVRRFPQKEKRALRRGRLTYFSNTFSIWPTFFWTLPASFSFWPSAARLGLFMTCPTFSLTLPFVS